MVEYVCGFTKDSDGVVLLVVKKKPDWQKGKLNGIGGKIEEGETPLQAMHREWFEETTLDPEEWIQFAKISRTDWLVHFFYAHSSKSFTMEGSKRIGLYNDEPWRNDIGEIIFPFYYPGDLVDPDLETISNIKYLLPLAFEKSKENNKHDLLEFV